MLRTAAKAPSRSQNLLPRASRSYRTCSATPQRTLFLDFLAPSAPRIYSASWQSTNSITAASSFRHVRRLTTTATSADPPPTSSPQSQPPHLARAVLNPRTDESGKPMLISIAPRAAHRLAGIAESDKNPNLALRVTVESGGCHGFQYLMDLVDLSAKPPAEDDTLFEGDKGAKVVIDEASLELLSGSTVDYTMELIGSQFKVTGIPGATSSCGCGTSFDIKI